MDRARKRGLFSASFYTFFFLFDTLRCQWHVWGCLCCPRDEPRDIIVVPASFPNFEFSQAQQTLEMLLEQTCVTASARAWDRSRHRSFPAACPLRGCTNCYEIWASPGPLTGWGGCWRGLWFASLPEGRWAGVCLRQGMYVGTVLRMSMGEWFVTCNTYFCVKDGTTIWGKPSLFWSGP